MLSFLLIFFSHWYLNYFISASWSVINVKWGLYEKALWVCDVTLYRWGFAERWVVTAWSCREELILRPRTMRNRREVANEERQRESWAPTGADLVTLSARPLLGIVYSVEPLHHTKLLLFLEGSLSNGHHIDQAHCRHCAVIHIILTKTIANYHFVIALFQLDNVS